MLGYHGGELNSVEILWLDLCNPSARNKIDALLIFPLCWRVDAEVRCIRGQGIRIER